jgi:STE24 endopeptidase
MGFREPFRAAARSGWTLALAIVLTLAAPLAARQDAGGEPAGAAPSPRLVVPDGARATPDFDVDRATEAYLDLISPEARARSDAYFEGGYWIEGLSWLWTLGVAVMLLGGGRMRRLRDAVRARIRSELGSDLATLAPILVASALLTLPLTIWLGYFREHAYGLSNQTFGAFLGDWAKGLAVGVVLGTPALAAIYAVVRRWPRSWWIRGTGVATMFLVFGVLIGPVFVAPLFNEYKKLEAGELRDDILAMARAHRIPADDVFWFDASKQTKRVSANVSGLGATMRISLNDNLLIRSPRETVLAVLGHEMGHYVLGHVAELILEIALVLAAGFAFVHFTFEPLRRRFAASWRIESLGDPAGWPLASALLATFFLLATPVTNTIIRANEAEADAFGIAVSAEPDGFAYAAVQLSEYRKMRPGKVEELVFYDHPSGYDRIHRAMSWKAEHLDLMAAKEAAAAERAEEATAAAAE